MANASTISALAASAPSADVTGALEALKDGTDRIAAVFLASVEGRTIACPGLRVSERAQLAGMSAALMAVARKGINDRQLGDTKQVQVVAGSGTILFLRVGSKAVLTLVVSDGEPLGSILDKARTTALQLETLI